MLDSTFSVVNGKLDCGTDHMARSPAVKNVISATEKHNICHQKCNIRPKM